MGRQFVLCKYPCFSPCFCSDFSDHWWFWPMVVTAVFSTAIIPSTCINWNSPVKELPFLLHYLLMQLFTDIQKNAWIFSILWVIIHCHHYLFHCSNCCRCGHTEFLQVGSWVLPTTFWIVSNFLFPDDVPDLSCIFSASSMESTTCPRSPGFCYWEMLLRKIWTLDRLTEVSSL